jgi:hypothetical protein
VINPHPLPISHHVVLLQPGGTTIYQKEFAGLIIYWWRIYSRKKSVND